MLRTSRETAMRAAEIHNGRSAFRRGLSLQDCPHLEGSNLREWWQHGWALEQEVVQIGRGGAHFPP